MDGFRTDPNTGGAEHLVDMLSAAPDTSVINDIYSGCERAHACYADIDSSGGVIHNQFVLTSVNCNGDGIGCVNPFIYVNVKQHSSLDSHAVACSPLPTASKRFSRVISADCVSLSNNLHQCPNVLCNSTTTNLSIQAEWMGKSRLYVW